MSEKTEEPTPRRLRKAREDGDSPVSAAVVQGFGFVVAVALAPAAVGALATRAGELIVKAIQQPQRELSTWSLTADVLELTLPIVTAAAVAAAAVGFVQTGGIVTFKKISPDLSRANPITGIKNLLGWQRFVGIVRALVAAVVVGWLAVDLLLDHGADLAYSTGTLAAAGVVAGALTKKLAWIAALVGLSLGALDVAVTRYAWTRRHRMSKDEIKREYKESEGDPEQKAARKRAHQEMLAGATVNAVKNATVLIVNPTHLATALSYRQDEDDAPRVVAKGEGDLARKMMDAARAYGVPVVRDIPVARALAELEIGDEIPEALYEAVAEILREAWEELQSDGASEDPASG